MNIEEFDTVVVFDTETTGLTDYKLRNRDPAQPALVQIAAAMYASPKGEEDWERVSLLYGMCDRDGVDIHPKAYDAHGISEGKCDALSTNTTNILYVLAGMLAKADVHVAHNITFDSKLLKCNAYRHVIEELKDVLVPEKQYCTMMVSTPIVQAPKKNGKKGNKWPTLEECMNFYFNESIVGAHDALVDIDACAKVYFELRRRGL